MKDLVILKGKEAVCDSLEVAERFHKRHKNVVQTIERLAENSADVKVMFQRSSYKDSYDREQPKFYMNRDGFSLLTMGFTGPEALQWKLDYIKAFNAMEKLLQEQQSSEWKFFRQQGKSIRLRETDTLKKLVEYAKARGSTNHKQVYNNYTRLANKTVGIKSIKDATTIQLNYLMLVENVFIQVIRSGMDLNKDYHDIYQDCKSKAIQLGNAVTIGVTA